MGDLRELITGEVARLRRYAYSLTRDRDRADDLVQASLERAIAKEHLWQEGTDLRAWLCTIVHHEHINQLRYFALRRHLEFCDNEPLLGRAGDQDVALLVRDLSWALSQLPEPQREVILLIGLEGMSYEAAAGVLSCPVGTVRSRLSRGREALDDLLGGPPPSAPSLDIDVAPTA